MVLGYMVLQATPTCKPKQTSSPFRSPIDFFSSLALSTNMDFQLISQGLEDYAVFSLLVHLSRCSKKTNSCRDEIQFQSDHCLSINFQVKQRMKQKTLKVLSPAYLPCLNFGHLLSFLTNNLSMVQIHGATDHSGKPKQKKRLMIMNIYDVSGPALGI